MLQPDSTFTFTGLPDCLPSPFGQQGHGKLLRATGKWQIRAYAGRWEADLHFDQGGLYPTGLSTNYFVAIVDSTYQLYTYLGDPDEAQVLMWTKSIGHQDRKPAPKQARRRRPK